MLWSTNDLRVVIGRSLIHSPGSWDRKHWLKFTVPGNGWQERKWWFRLVVEHFRGVLGSIRWDCEWLPKLSKTCIPSVYICASFTAETLNLQACNPSMKPSELEGKWHAIITLYRVPPFIWDWELCLRVHMFILRASPLAGVRIGVKNHPAVVASLQKIMVLTNETADKQIQSARIVLFQGDIKARWI